MPLNEGPELARKVLEWADHPEPPDLVGRLVAFHDWLQSEALPGGGIGPAEGQRLWSRHIADSLTFLVALGDVTNVVDVGSGVGLPGIPLAIALPAVQFTLLDRSERRCWLARRVTRILGLDNVEVVQGDAKTLRLPHSAAVTRASLPLVDFFALASILLPDGRVAVAAGSHGTGTPVEGAWQVVRVPADVLGEAAWLAVMPLPQ